MDQPEATFRDLCEHAHDLIQSVSPEGRFVYVNRAWLETLGYTRDEVEHLSVFDVVHPDSLEHCQRVFSRLVEDGTSVHVEAAFRTKDGKKIALEGHASTHFEGGRPLRTRGIFRDVTDRVRTAEERQRLFDLSLDLLCVAGTDGYFKQVNPAFERVLGYTQDQLLSRSFIDFVHPDDRAATLLEVSRLAEGRTVVDFQNRYRASDGSFRWLSWRSTPLPEIGLIYAIARDITEQKRLEGLTRLLTEDLARSNAELERFAYAASHDLRAPLRAIGNLGNWIADELGAEAPAKVVEHIAVLKERVERMDALISDLLKYSRIQRDAGELVEVDTAAMIEELVFLLAPPTGLTIAMKPDLPVLVTPRPPLEQVFRNLIENAIKHHDRTAGRIEIAAVDRGSEVEFSVMDDGPGIPAESRERVFRMFHQIRQNDSQGTGIGLALVKRVVELYGGHVCVEPGEGRGTTFRFTWPKSVSSGDAHGQHSDRG